MSIQQIREDMLFLAGRLAHRRTQTDGEQAAAQYILDRLRATMPEATLEPFDAVDSQEYITASYLAEFFMVAIIAYWWPFLALCYGAVIMAAYLAEYSGIPAFSRFLPQYESANIIGRYYAPKPTCLIVVCAHYDSGTATPLTQPEVAARMRWIHRMILAAMAIVLATCAVEGWAQWNGRDATSVVWIRWGILMVLGAAAAAHFYAAVRGGEVRGANCNASGVAALLRLAEMIQDPPTEHADIWLAATGAQERWMAGMRQIVDAVSPHRSYVHFINLEGVGAGRPIFTTSEGMLFPLECGKELISAATAEAAPYGFTAAPLRATNSSAHIPLSRNLSAISIMGLDEKGIPPHWRWFTDSLGAVDESAVERAAEFAAAIIHHLDRPVVSQEK